MARDKEPVSAAVAPNLAEPKSPTPTTEQPPDPQPAGALAARQPELRAQPASPAEVSPREKDQVPTTCVRTPHDPEATYSAKGQGHQKREHVGYKVQVAETVREAALAAGEPTRNFIVGMSTHPAYESDETGSVKTEQEQARMGLDKPLVQYAMP